MIIKKILHWFEHILGKNSGDVISWHDNDYFYISFKCKGCGQIDEKLTMKTPLQEKKE